MKKLITLGLLGLLMTSLMFADDASQPEMQETTEVVKASHGYVSLGVGPLPWPLPFFGVGHRMQEGHHGFDASLQAFYFGRAGILKENFNYLHYFKPKLASQFYMGAGIGVTEVIGCGGCAVLLSPEIVLGKQYTNKDGDVRFFQAQIDPVFLNVSSINRKGSWGAYPAIMLTYGICF